MAVRKRQAGNVLCGVGIAVALVSLFATGGLTAATGITLGALTVAGIGFVLALERLSLSPALNAEEEAAFDSALSDVEAERKSLQQLRRDLEAELERRAEQLDQRESQLANRLIAFQEWLEYPQPDDSSENDVAAALFVGPELEIKDHRVIELLETEATFVYERIRDGRYREDGQLKIEAIRNDTLDLIQRVARIYRPDSDNPLLETSVEKLLRAGSRVCLHLLVVLERLPLDLHEESFSTLHEYVRRAVKAYDVYTAAEPYLGYASKALYVGRLAMGANPLTLGVTWALTELGRRGVKAVGQKFVDQQAVALLGDLVRVIGFEVAGIYGGDFRHRDPNWVYGSELTDLMSRFPVSRQNLAHALREIGALTFRNEYDRVFLYRCLSTHRSAAPPPASHDFLPSDARQEIARKLESFFRNFVHGKTERGVTEWRIGVESRLGLRLRLDSGSTDSLTPVSAASQDAAAAIASLIAFATAVKGRDLSHLSPATLAPKTSVAAGSSTVSVALRSAVETPPQFFEGADIDPGSDLLDAYVADLIRLAVRSEPLDVQADDLVLETAVWLGRDAGAVRKQLDAEYSEFARDLLPPDAPNRKVSASVSRTLLSELLPDESARFVYPDVRLLTSTTATSNPPGEASLPKLPRNEKLWLSGTDQRLLLIAESLPHAIATSPLYGLSATKGDGLVVSECNLSGGQWTLPSEETSFPLDLAIAGGVMTRFDSWFRPLLEVVRSSAK
ncbi:hypothetical protein GC176_16350 [bacterium]|nr:hypothetical protein [bacterium]